MTRERDDWRDKGQERNGASTGWPELANDLQEKHKYIRGVINRLRHCTFVEWQKIDTDGKNRECLI